MYQYGDFVAFDAEEHCLSNAGPGTGMVKRDR
jgi:hypothetical protein